MPTSLLQRAADSFHSRSERERRALRLAAFIVPLALVLLLADLLLSERSRLSHDLPQVRHSVERMEVDALELARLRSVPRTAGVTDVASLSASARARGMDVTIQASDGRFQLSGTATLAQLLPWLADQQTESYLRVAELQFDGVEAQRVSAILILPDSTP